MKKIFSLSLLTFFFSNVFCQIDAGLFRFPDVSTTQIVFTYANDIWVIPKSGGTAIRISSPAGIEYFPKFSPDGKSIAYSANYDGNREVYVLPVNGGIPARLTTHGGNDVVVDWTKDGKRILFSSGRESGKARFSQLYTIAINGGAAEKLPVAYGDLASYSSDGKQMALTFRSQIFRTWKRYRGGSTAGIHIFNFTDQTSKNISSDVTAGNEFPMWKDNFIYFLSDRGTENRMNLWRYNIENKTNEQITRYADYDVHFPSMGPDDIVFEQAGKLCLYNFQSGEVKIVSVNIVTDRAMLRPKTESVANLIQYVGISPDGNRALIQARGDLFSLPAKDGYVKNLSMTSGAAERYPSWSPDGKSIAYWSDASGEYELYIKPAAGGLGKKITSYGKGYRYHAYWSPDSKKISFIDQTNTIQIVEVANGNTIKVDKALRYTDAELNDFKCSWSPDSRWMAYKRDLENWHSAIFIFDFQEKKSRQITSGFYNVGSPMFDVEGKYLFLTTAQNFQTSYSDFDNSFVYANSQKIAAISLEKETISITAPKNDTVSVKTEKEEGDKKKETKKEDKKKDKKEPEKKPAPTPVKIDFDNIESRLVMLPVDAGNIAKLVSIKGKLIFIRYPNTGVENGKTSIKYYDIEKREEKTMLEANDYWVSHDNQKMLVVSKDAYAIVPPTENVKFESPLKVAEMMMNIDPKEEWKQIFTDAWRLQRDFFYDDKMHGVNWDQVKERYGKMLEGAMTRDDLSFILGEMVGELNASHTYVDVGDNEKEKRQNTGYLGIDWKADGEYYSVKKILRAAAWDAEVRSVLDEPGCKIKEGDYILAINGIPVTTDKEPFAAFAGLANKTIEITYNNKKSFDGAKTAIVSTLASEYRLRHLAWIETMRKRVEEASKGEVGYIYVPSTGVDGQTELMRQLNAQVDKKALIIDERFNDGGQIPDRFIEMLNRTPLAYWATRDGESWPWPPYSNFGPKLMLINGWSGSGGDAFPDYFRKKGLGPLIGTRTWGGLIGISGEPVLIDGGAITVPSFRMYNVDGTWFKEGHGVDPDIEVPEDLAAMAKGIDPQLERAITEIKNLLAKGFKAPAIPAKEIR